MSSSDMLTIFRETPGNRDLRHADPLLLGELFYSREHGTACRITIRVWEPCFQCSLSAHDFRCARDVSEWPCPPAEKKRGASGRR